MANREPISIIKTAEYTYFNLHAEEVFASSYSGKEGEGIYANELNMNTFNLIAEYLNNNNDIKVVAFDFKGIDKLQANLVDKLIKLKDSCKNLVFVNIEKSIVENEDGIKVVKNKNNVLKESIYERYYYFSEDIPDIQNLIINEKELFDKAFQELIKQYCFPSEEDGKPRINHSSSVYLNSYVNLKDFFAKERNFAFYAIYRLAMKIANKEEWNIKREKRSDYDAIKVHDKILVCQSLNGSYITSILSTLLKIDVLIFDKIGPVNKLYSRPNKLINTEKQYIVVSDLVCLGTEVKIVKSILQFLGAGYLGNVALIKTETIKKIKDPTLAVFAINADNNAELNYGLYTNLKSII
jgi:hypothetical protein